MKDRLLLPMTMKKAKIGALNGQRVRGHLNYPSLSLSLQLQKIVWEVCFCTYMCHVVFESGFRGIIPLRNLLAPPWPAGTAICCCETLDHRRPISHRASTGLLNYNMYNLFCKKAQRKQFFLLGAGYVFFHDHCQR